MIPSRPAARVFYPARYPALPLRPFSSGSTPLRSTPNSTYQFSRACTHRLTAQLPLRSDGSTGREHRESSRTFARRSHFHDSPPLQLHPGKTVESKRGKFLSSFPSKMVPFTNVLLNDVWMYMYPHQCILILLVRSCTWICSKKLVRSDMRTSL